PPGPPRLPYAPLVRSGLKGDEAAGVDPQHFAGTEDAFMEGAAGVEEGPAVALKALHDEAFPAEQTGADPLVEGDADAHALGGAEDRKSTRLNSSHVKS